MSDQQHEVSPSKWDAAWKDVVAGSVRGATQIAVGHPFDTLKVRLQVNAATSKPTQTPRGTPEFKGLFHCSSETWRCDGIRGFYKGATSPILGCVIYSATLFFAWGQSQILVRSLSSTPKEDPLTLPQLICAGMLTGTAASFVEGPVDLIKTKLQTQYNPQYLTSSSSSVPLPVQKKKMVYSGSCDCFRALVRQKGGFLNLYAGVHATFLRNIPGSVTYFSSYELFSRILSPYFPSSSSSTKSRTVVMMAGGLAGIVFWITIFPFDVIKSHIQSKTVSPPLHADPSLPSPIMKRLTIRKAFWELYGKGGWKRFFSGLSPAMLRAFPTNGLSFLAFETCRSFLG